MPPDYSQITKHIAIGSSSSLDNDLPFDVIFVCAEELQEYGREYAVKHKRTRVFFVPLDDHKPTTTEITAAAKAAVVASRLIRRGRSVLFVCAAGLNRSSWVAAMTMMELGATADQAISRIRTNRRHPMGFMPLFNKDFLAVLKMIDLKRQTVTR